APHAGMTWVSGGWVYNESTAQYAWQAGYWTDSPGNMVYQPGQYRMTNYGYAYAPGYWDYCLEDRGLLYAPVYFDRPLWHSPAYATQVRQSAAVASLGYTGVQSVPPLSRATTTVISGAGSPGPAALQVPANTVSVASPKLVQPAPQVLRQQQVTVRPTTPVGI